MSWSFQKWLNAGKCATQTDFSLDRSNSGSAWEMRDAIFFKRVHTGDIRSVRCVQPSPISFFMVSSPLRAASDISPTA